MNLTFDEAIENHRKMWNWIADETEKRGRIVTKDEYFEENDIAEDIFMGCFCCEYGARQVGSYSGCDKCNRCPIDWGDRNCEEFGSPYDGWSTSCNYESAAKYAREIANLPEREDVRR